MWEFFLRKSRFTYLLMVVLIAVGYYSVLMIPKENTPEIIIPIGVVTTVLPGAPALDIETLITNEIERGLTGTLSNVKKITSTSRESVSSVTVEFDASANIDDSLQDLKDRIDIIASQLPADAEDPQVIQVDFVDVPILTLAVAGDRTDAELAALASALEVELEKVPSVSKVESIGVRDREITVTVTPEALARFDLTINQVIDGLRASNNTFPIGQIISGGISYNIAFEGNIENPAAVRNIPITVRGGQPIYLRDIATVDEGLAAATSLSRLSVGGKPSAKAVTINVFKQRGGDITRVTKEVQEVIAELQKDNGLLAGLESYVILDAGEEIADSLGGLVSSGLQTVLLVILVLIIAIGWREGLIAGLAIPLSFTIGFIGLYLSGNTINFISLFALILGIGVLVDAGIVMVEGINKQLKDNPEMNKREAAFTAVRLFASPLIAGTLTTVAMFTGLFIVSGITGQFIAGIPFTIIFVLFAALLVALGFLPLLASTFLRRRNATRFEATQVAYAHKVENWYRNRITRILLHRRSKVFFVAGIMVAFFGSFTLIPLGLVKVVFFEQTDVDAIYIDLELPEGTTKETTDVAVRQIEEVLYERPADIEAFSVSVGSGNAFSGGGLNEKLASITVNLDPNRTKTSTEIIEELRTLMPNLPGVIIAVSEPNNGPPTGSPIGVKLLGDDLSILAEATTLVEQHLQTTDGVINVTTSNTANNSEFVLTLDKARAASLGLTPLTVSQTVRAAVFGSEATSLTTLTDDIPVTVRLNLTGTDEFSVIRYNDTTIDRINNIALPTNTGQSVPLSTVTTVSLRESNAAINHENQTRVMTVSADTTATGNVREINAALTAKLAEPGFLPDGVSFAFGGEAEESAQAFIELFLALIVGIGLMITVLVLQFNSFRYTAYVLSILPFSLIGILGGLAITGSALSFPSIMGFIALTGIIVNNSILLIDMMNYRRTIYPNERLVDSVVEAATNRLRPIILTSLTTIIGMIPLLSSDPIWVPLATAIIFGLSFSVFITLILVPIIYLKWPGRGSVEV